MGCFFCNTEERLLSLRADFEAAPTFEKYARLNREYGEYCEDYRETYGRWPILFIREIDAYAPKKEWQVVADAFNALPWEEKKKYYAMM